MRRLCLLAVLLAALAALPARGAGPRGPVEVLRVQLVLMARNDGDAIPADAAERATGWLREQVAGLSVDDVLRGTDRIIVNFLCPVERKDDVELAIKLLPQTPAGSALRVEAWKPSIEKVKPDETQLVPSEHRLTERGRLDVSLDAKDPNYLRVTARDVDLDALLDTLGGVLDFSYVCSGELGRTRISMRARSVQLEELLTQLKTALNLSVRRVGGAYVFLPGAPDKAQEEKNRAGETEEGRRRRP